MSYNYNYTCENGRHVIYSGTIFSYLSPLCRGWAFLLCNTRSAERFPQISSVASEEDSKKENHYPLVMTNITIEHGHL